MTDDSCREQQVMDKKNFNPPPTKSALPQLESSRPRLDVAGGSQTPKSQSKSQFRRRESPAGSSNVQNFRQDGNSSRKPSPQKSKALDKRPRPRSLNCQEQVARKEDSPEYGSVQTPGSKKQNLNHLLNFYFTPRENKGLELRSNVHVGSGAHGRSKYLKESYIQANCQFMVERDTDNGDYGAYKYDPDVLVNWKSIEQILIRTYGETPVCPICLSPPCAAKMTRCGHIFCWPCVLHYLSYADKLSQPCPICYEPLTRQDLKSVVANMCEEWHTGDSIEMQLMCRPKDSSTVEMPLACKIGEDIDWERRFKKLVLVSPEQVKAEVLDREHDELNLRYQEVIERIAQEVKQGYSENVVSIEEQFVTDAMLQLESRSALVSKKLLQERSMHGQTELSNADVGSDAGTRDVELPQNLLFREQELKLNAVDQSAKSPVTQFSEQEFMKDDNFNSYHCYYQATDGRNAFMNPLNMAMLWKSFGEHPGTWPQRVQFRILEIEYLTMTTELRKRYKFLQHVPVNTCVQLIEVELKAPMISEEVMKYFAPQINQRKRRRSERVRQEKRRERLQLDAERRSQPQHPKIESRFDFPTCGAAEEEFQGLEHAILASLSEESRTQVEYGGREDDDGELYGEVVGAMQIPTAAGSSRYGSDGFPVLRETPMSTSPSMSFAQALTASPSVGAPIWKRSPTYPLTTGAHSGQSLRRIASEAETEEGSSVPEYRASVSDAISRAFAAVNINDESEANGNGGGAGQKKKGRKKGKVLFATGMGMGNS